MPKSYQYRPVADHQLLQVVKRSGRRRGVRVMAARNLTQATLSEALAMVHQFASESESTDKGLLFSACTSPDSGLELLLMYVNGDPP